MSGDCGAVGLWSMKGMDAETRTCREPPPPLDVAGETGEMIDVEVPTVATPLVRDALYSETSRTKKCSTSSGYTIWPRKSFCY